MTVFEIYESELSTQLLEAMHASTVSMAKNLKTLGYYPKELLGWQFKLAGAIDLRKQSEAEKRMAYAN